MKPDKEKDITERMVEMLRKHSQPYEEGAWERFKEYEAGKKRKAIFWPYLSGVAAMVLLGVALFLKQDDVNVQSEPEIVQTDIPVDSVLPETIDSSPTVIDEKPHLADVNGVRGGAKVAPDATMKENQPAQGELHERQIQLMAFTRGDEQYNAAAVQQEGTAPEQMRATAQTTEEIKPAAVNQRQNETQTLAQSNRTYDEERAYLNDDGLFADNLDDHPDLNGRLNKWDFSLELAPNINERQQVNFGGGVAIAYNINDKISISSGVSYVQLDAQRGPNRVDIPVEFAKASLNSYNYNKSLNTINTTLVGLDIPVNLKVNLGSQIYASAGVSIFSVLSESRYNIFEEKRTHLASVTADGRVNPEPAIQTVYSQEASPNTPYEGKNFTGFFNLSVGYKLPMLRNLNLSVEPYLKVPVGSLTDQDMNLGNGGLKIVTSF